MAWNGSACTGASTTTARSSAQRPEARRTEARRRQRLPSRSDTASRRNATTARGGSAAGGGEDRKKGEEKRERRGSERKRTVKESFSSRRPRRRRPERKQPGGMTASTQKGQFAAVFNSAFVEYAEPIDQRPFLYPADRGILYILGASCSQKSWLSTLTSTPRNFAKILGYPLRT